MNFLIEHIEESSKFKELSKSIKQKQSPIAISGLTDVEKVSMLTAISKNTNGLICIVTYNELQAQKLCKDLKAVGKKALYFPKREIAAYDYVAQSKDLPYERIEVLNQIMLAKAEKRQVVEKTNQKENEKIESLVIVTTIEAVMQKMITKQNLYQNKIEFKLANTYHLETLKETFIMLRIRKK